MAKTRARKRTIALRVAAFGTAGGYANFSEQLGLAIARSGARIAVTNPVRRAGTLNAEKLLTVPVNFEPTATLHVSAPNAWDRSGPTLAVGTCGSSVLPPASFASLRNVDRVFVPHALAAEAYHALAPEHIEITPVSLGVDTDTFRAEKRTRGRILRILYFATDANEWRKGLDLAVEAFRKAFASFDDVEMTVRSTCPIAPIGGRIQTISGLLSSAELAKVYGSHDALMHTSRGDGFGLIPLEAMATGLPVIHSGVAATEVLRDFGICVPHRRLVAQGKDRPRGEWYEPDRDSLVSALRLVTENYDVAQEQGFNDAVAIADRFSWDKTAGEVLARF